MTSAKHPIHSAQQAHAYRASNPGRALQEQIEHEKAADRAQREYEREQALIELARRRAKGGSSSRK